MNASPLSLRYLSHLVVCCVAIATTQPTQADTTPFGQTAPVGFAARTFATANPDLRTGMQTVRWDAPGDLTITTYASGTGRSYVTPEAEPVAIQTGHVHRFRLTGFADAEALELYPSVELIDRLHPPEGEDARFPVVLELTERDLQDALDGRLVTKIVYVQPRNAQYIDPVLTKLPTTRLPLSQNVMAEATLRGRPIAIVRLGTRAPMVGESAAFYGTGGRVVSPVPVGGFIHAETAVCGPCGPSSTEPTNARRYPDEYICDGGDTGVATVGPIATAAEIDFEETVGVFLDADGTVQTRESSRVCIYAPAFGAVTVGSSGQVDTLVLKPAGAAVDRTSSGVAAQLPPILHEARVADGGVRMRERLSGLINEQSDSVETVSLTPGLESKVVGSFEEFGFASPLLTTLTNRLVIGERIAAAIEWSENRSPIIIALDESLTEVISPEIGGEFVHYEDRRPPGELLLVKTADRRTAQVGETVTFAIRFENNGGKPLREVTLTDHLSPRLAYVPESLECSVDAETDVSDDGFGSVLITVTLKEPLAAGDGGTVTFATTVR